MSRSCGTSSSATSDRPPSEDERLSAVTVLFSGGADSTLTASMLSERFDHVHLLTFRHPGIMMERKCLRSLAALRRAYGEGRFSHQIIDVSKIMSRIFVRPLRKDLRRYGTYALPMCCAACRLSMHVATIQYNREQGIRHAADGANQEVSELFPEQMRSTLGLYRGLYQRFGMEYSNPVFHIDRTDHVLYDLGITDKRDLKDEHVVYSNQHSCQIGTLLYAYTLGVALPLRGRSSDEEQAERYTAEKIEEYCIPYLEGEECHALLRAS